MKNCHFAVIYNTTWVPWKMLQLNRFWLCLQLCYMRKNAYKYQLCVELRLKMNRRTTDSCSVDGWVHVSHRKSSICTPALCWMHEGRWWRRVVIWSFGAYAAMKIITASLRRELDDHIILYPARTETHSSCKTSTICILCSYSKCQLRGYNSRKHAPKSNK